MIQLSEINRKLVKSKIPTTDILKTKANGQTEFHTHAMTETKVYQVFGSFFSFSWVTTHIALDFNNVKGEVFIIQMSLKTTHLHVYPSLM